MKKNTKLHNRSAADDFQVRDPGQVGQNFILHAVGKKTRSPDRCFGFQKAARRCFSPGFVLAQIQLYQPGQRVPENANHSEADRTSDRAEGEQQ
jgi:hypothetical protein